MTVTVMPLHFVAESPMSTASCPGGLAAAVSERLVRGRAPLEHAHRAQAEEEPPQQEGAGPVSFPAIPETTGQPASVAARVAGPEPHLPLPTR